MALAHTSADLPLTRPAGESLAPFSYIVIDPRPACSLRLGRRLAFQLVICASGLVVVWCRGRRTRGVRRAGSTTGLKRISR